MAGLGFAQLDLPGALADICQPADGFRLAATGHVDRAKAGQGVGYLHQRRQLVGRHRTSGIEFRACRAPPQRVTEQRVTLDIRIFDKAHMRDGAFVQPVSRFAFREPGDLQPVTLFGRGLTQQFEESAEADRRLAVWRVAEQGEAVVAVQPDHPWLQIVRAGRKDGIGRGVETGIAKALGCLPPGLACRGDVAHRREARISAAKNKNAGAASDQECSPGKHRCRLS